MPRDIKNEDLSVNMKTPFGHVLDTQMHPLALTNFRLDGAATFSVFTFTLTAAVAFFAMANQKD
jgi:hypothetical protein